jgi:hypothetical protein
MICDEMCNRVDASMQFAARFYLCGTRADKIDVARATARIAALRELHANSKFSDALREFVTANLASRLRHRERVARIVVAEFRGAPRAHMAMVGPTTIVPLARRDR